MALQCVVILSLFLVLVGATMAYPGPSAELHTIDYYPDEQVQFLGRYAVEVHNNKSKPHLIFQKVVNGTVFTIPTFSNTKERTWDLELMVINCSESGSPSKYIVQLYENLYFSNEYGNKIIAYGSTFTASW